MVDVIIKGTSKSEYGKRGFVIGKINAGIILRDEGGIFLTLSDQSLSKELKELFEKHKDLLIGDER
jgi:hypothetical protein